MLQELLNVVIVIVIVPVKSDLLYANESDGLQVIASDCECWTFNTDFLVFGGWIQCRD